jgi:hypothetical protein
LFGDEMRDIAECLAATVLLGQGRFCDTKGATTVFARMLIPIGKRHRKSVLALGLAVVVLVAVVAVVTVLPGIGRTAHASGSGGGGCVASNGPSCTFKDHSAFADFGSASNDQCSVVTDANVNVFQNLQRPGKTAGQMVFVFISQYDCNGNTLEGASNFDPNTGAPNFTGTIQFGKDITTASVNGTATMFDFISNTSFTTTINLTFQAYGPTATTIDNSHTRGFGFIVNNHFHGSDRAAEASGTFTNADGSNLASAPTFNADMNFTSGGTVILNKP